MGSPGREPTVSDEEILNVFHACEDPVVSTREVADAIGLSRRGTFDRLQDLANEDELKMKKLDPTHTVWWNPRALRDRYSQSN